MHAPIFHSAIALVLWAIGLQPLAAETTRIWDRAQHCAFTDLVHWQGAFYCTFRESDAHVHGSDGKIRVIRSPDGDTWESVALLVREGTDLRDPKLSVTPEGKLMLLYGGSIYREKELVRRHPYVAFLAPGEIAFSETVPIVVDERIAGENDWLWRVTWHEGVAYGVIYQSDCDPWGALLVKSADGVRYDLVASLGLPDKPNEATVRFGPDGAMRIVIRNDGGSKVGYLGRAVAPFTDWNWTPINARLGGPDFLRLPDGTWLLGTRFYDDDGSRFVLGALHPDGTFTPTTTLPSGGDCSYPGLLLHDDMLWVSYYSSHENGTASIYLHRQLLPPS